MTDAPAPPRLVVCAGHATLDAIVAVPRLPRRDERLAASGGIVAGGGPAATAAVALARLGIPSAFAGRVADDATGALIRAGLEAEGVDTSLLETVRGTSPFSAVLADGNGGRSIIAAPGDLPPLELTAALRGRLRQADWLHVDHVGATLLPAVRATGIRIPVSIDGGNPIPDLSLDGVTLYVPTVDALLARTRAQTVVEGVTKVLDEGATSVVVTRGSGGATAAWRARGQLELLTLPGVRVRGLVSTLGAGDVFHGALLASIVDGFLIADAVVRANTAAAASTRALDGRSAIPRRAELEAMLAAGEIG